MSSLLELSAELLFKVQSYAGNFPQQRLVCTELNAVASVLLLEDTISKLRSNISTYSGAITRRLESGGDGLGGAVQLQQLVDDVHSLNSMKEELDKILRNVGEKNRSLAALREAQNLSERDRTLLLKLCDLHPEFLSVSAVSSRIKDIALRSGILSVKRPMADDPAQRYREPLRVGPHHPGGNRRPRYPGPGPEFGFDPFAREPDPDHMRPPGFADEDDDRDFNPFPVFPGQPLPGQDPLRVYPPGGVRPQPGFPGGGGGGGGVGGYPPPGYNPDFDRDLNPLGPLGPLGGPGGRPPRGPFNPGGGFGGNGGFGGPRFL